MDYELARKLDDAGFPQKSNTGSHIRREYHDSGEECSDCVEDLQPYGPSLSELIEACGYGFFRLTCQPKMKRFIAESDNWKDGIGSAPEEAVPKLWLAISRK